jgi:NAD+ diphosphatase
VSSLDGLSLSRATVDRAAHRRVEAGLLEQLLSDDDTRVLVLAGDRVLVAEEGDEDAVHVTLLGPREMPQAARAAALPLYLGEDESARSYLGLAVPADSAEGWTPPDAARWAGLRDVGALLDDEGAGLFTATLALANWHAAHPRCARCGSPTEVVQAGWARRCPHCGAEHYPRTDPAVIMSVVDEEDRILLGRQASWPERRYSTLAGFVEPGESLEAAVRREVAEESGVEIGDVEYRGSQPWPFPSSLMLGFRAQAVTTGAQADGVELAHARWWTRDQFAADLAADRLRLPPRVSIARRLIEDWYGGPVG